jgi:hypothetical protein
MDRVRQLAYLVISYAIDYAKNRRDPEDVRKIKSLALEIFFACDEILSQEKFLKNAENRKASRPHQRKRCLEPSLDQRKRRFELCLDQSKQKWVLKIFGSKGLVTVNSSKGYRYGVLQFISPEQLPENHRYPWKDMEKGFVFSFDGYLTRRVLRHRAWKNLEVSVELQNNLAKLDPSRVSKSKTVEVFGIEPGKVLKFPG